MWYRNVNTKSLIQINSSDERTSTSADIRFKDFLVIAFDCLPVLKDFIFPKSKSCLRFVTKGVLKTWFAGGSSMRKSSFWKKYQIRGGFAGGSQDFALSRSFWKNRQYLFLHLCYNFKIWNTKAISPFVFHLKGMKHLEGIFSIDIDNILNRSEKYSDTVK